MSARKPSRYGEFVQGTNAAGRVRRHIERTGQTLAGQRLWSEREVKILRRCYPDYREADVLLSDRSPAAVRSKASTLRITRSRKVWTEGELKRMRRPYLRGIPLPEIKEILPGKTSKQIWRRASYNGWYRPRRPPKAFGIQPYDSVRARAFELRLSMRDLAFLTSTGSYFLRQPARIDWVKIGKAVALLDGALLIAWPSQHARMSARQL